MLNSKIILIVFVVINLAITVPLSYFLNVYQDEVYSLNTTSKDISYAWKQALEFEVQAPLYFILLKLWRSLDSSIFFARLLSVTFILLTIFSIKKVSEKYVSEVNPIFVSIIFAINPYTIWAATEIRPYAMVIFITSILMYFFYEAYLVNQSSKSSRIIYIIVTIVALLTHYFLILLLAAITSVLIITKNWQSLKHYLVDMIIPLLLFLLLFLIIPSQLSYYSSEVSITRSLPGSLYWLINTYEGLIFAIKDLYYDPEMMQEIYLYPLGRWILRGTIVAILTIGIISIKQRYSRLILQNKAILILFAVLSLLYISIHYIFGSEIILPRYLSVVFIPLLIVFYSFMVSNFRKPLKILLSVIILSCSGSAMYSIYTPMVKMNDFKRMSSFISEHENFNQPILVFRNIHVLPLSYHYEGVNCLYPISPPIHFSHAPPLKDNWVFENGEQIQSVISIFPGSPKEFWIIFPPKSLIRNYKILEKYLDDNFSVMRSQIFYSDMIVKLLRRKGI